MKALPSGTASLLLRRNLSMTPLSLKISDWKIHSQVRIRRIQRRRRLTLQYSIVSTFRDRPKNPGRCLGRFLGGTSLSSVAFACEISAKVRLPFSRSGLRKETAVSWVSISALLDVTLPSRLSCFCCAFTAFRNSFASAFSNCLQVFSRSSNSSFNFYGSHRNEYLYCVTRVERTHLCVAIEPYVFYPTRNEGCPCP